jgi:hypothetical protein
MYSGRRSFLIGTGTRAVWFCRIGRRGIGRWRWWCRKLWWRWSGWRQKNRRENRSLNKSGIRRSCRTLRSIRKSGFMEDDIPRDVHSARFYVKAFIAFVMLTVPKKKAFFGALGEFMSVVRPEIWKTRAPKYFKKLVIRNLMKYFL